MVQVISFGILLEKTETASVGTRCLVNNVVGLIEVNLIVVAYYLSLGLGLQTHLDDVSRLVVEQAVGVPQPGYGTEEHTK